MADGWLQSLPQDRQKQGRQNVKLFCHLSSRFHKIKKDTGIGESKADIRNPQTDQFQKNDP